MKTNTPAEINVPPKKNCVQLTNEHRALFRKTITEHGGQVIVAKAVGMQQANLSQILCGKYNPSVAVIERLAKVLGLECTLTPARLKLHRKKRKADNV